MGWQIRQGDAVARLREMPAGSVQCAITSPPYFGLRDYGTGEWDGGDPDCLHRASELRRGVNLAQSAASTRGGAKKIAEAGWIPFRDVCGHCGARRVDGQVGLESSPDEYVERLVGVFREVWRVLRDDGVLWLNLGDSYNAYNGNAGHGGPVGLTQSIERPKLPKGYGLTVKSLKSKDLIGVPWMVAFALRADGWYLRSDVIWAKPNPMPESVTDRPTSAHEHLFLLAKSPRYFYDADAIREPHSDVSLARALRNRFGGKYQGSDPAEHGALKAGNGYGPDGDPDIVCSPGGRNKRNVWEIATMPYAEAHFATFPPKLVEPCVLAGTSPRACGVCWAPWRRVVEKEATGRIRDRAGGGLGTAIRREPLGYDPVDGEFQEGVVYRTTGWEPTCEHSDDSGRCLVLDPFCGSGTVGVVCEWYDRHFMGIELNPDYCQMAERRIRRRDRPSQAPDVSPDQLVFDMGTT